MRSAIDILAHQSGFASYNSYLKSEHWQAFSAQHKGWKCAVCGFGDKLQLHHICYDRLGAELPSDVITVCDRCHVGIHALVKQGEPLLNAHLAFAKVSGKRGTKAKIKHWRGRWQNLARHGKYKTTYDLMIFLQEHRLLDMMAHPQPTAGAFERGFARQQGKDVMWSVKKYEALARQAEHSTKQGEKTACMPASPKETKRMRKLKHRQRLARLYS